MRLPCRLGAATAATVFLLCATAASQPSPTDKALATELFNQGRTLLAQGQTAEACRKLEESQRLDPASGTLLNLAVCHEKQGRTASAWAEFRDARVLAQRDNRDDRVALADEHIRALEGKLSKLTVNVPPAATAPALVVELDGGALPPDAWGIPLPVDPGEHTIEASAPGRSTWTGKVLVGPEGDVQTVALPKLESSAPGPPRTSPPLPSAPAASTGPAPLQGEAPTAAAPTFDPTRRTIAIVAGAVGLVGIGIGSYFGVLAFAKKSESDAECPGGQCSDRGVQLNDTAKLAADISTVAFATGIVGVAAGTYLWLTSRRASSSTSVRVVPRLSQTTAGVGLQGTF